MIHLFIHLPIFIDNIKMDFCGHKKQHSMAVIRNQKLGIEQERGGDKREKDSKNIHKSHPHPLFFFIYFEI